MIERSKAIKSPNIQVHLVGAKIVQQKLFEAGSVERFIKDNEIAQRIRATFVELFAINVGLIPFFRQKNDISYVRVKIKLYYLVS